MNVGPFVHAIVFMTTMMTALIYGGPGKRALEQRPRPEIRVPTDAIVRMVETSICGTDLHILKGDVLTCNPGRILGHEDVGIVDAGRIRGHDTQHR